MNKIMTKLEQNWIELTKKYVADENIVKKYFNDITEKYTESNRFYHNLEHISEMIDFINLNKNIIEDFDSIMFSVWFHDYEYNPLMTDNEEKSANKAKSFLKEISYDREKYKIIYRNILRTANHSEFKRKDNTDLRLFLDSDIMIFASDNEKYSLYSENIRKEYSFIQEFRYNKGRIKVLKKFLKNKYIFHLKEHRQMYDEIARKNIKNEIEILSGKL